MKNLRTAYTAILVLAFPATQAGAQGISLKTVPIPTGEQFALLPSHNFGMSGVSISIDDALLDPFTNPARGAFVTKLQLHALPTFYGEASNSVGGRSFPIAGVVPGRRVFGAFAFAMQQIDNPNRAITPIFFEGDQGMRDESFIQDNSSSNTYIQGTLGTRIGEATAVGASFFHAKLGAIDAVNLLYGNSSAINQNGSIDEARLGVTHDLGNDRTLDAVLLRNTIDMTHDVLYMNWGWSGDPRLPPVITSRRELNQDHTITWGAHLRYTQPLSGSPTTKLGVIVTGNTKDHPKIPNYDIVNVPRDPGNSAVFNIGAGVTEKRGLSTFSMELVFEPGRSHTWAYADTLLMTPTGTIQPGGKTIDNRFEFANWNLAAGLEREGERYGFQLGMRIKQTSYTLDQQNFMASTTRSTEEDWLEWSPAWSGVVKFPEFELRYSGRFTARGWPSTGFDTVVMKEPAMDTDFLVAPTGPVFLPEYRVTTHRFMVSVPLGR